MRRCLSYCSLIYCFLSICSQHSQVWAASAVSAPTAARETAAGAIDEAQNIRERDQEAVDRAEAAAYTKKAAEEAQAASVQLTLEEQKLARLTEAAQKAHTHAQAMSLQAKAVADKAAALRATAGAAEAEAQAASANADALDAALEAEEREQELRTARQEQAEEQAAAAEAQEAARMKPRAPVIEDTDELLTMEREIKALEKQQKEADLLRQKAAAPVVLEAAAEPDVDWSKADEAYAYADGLSIRAEAADQKANEAERLADDRVDAAEIAEEKAADAKEAVADAKLNIKDAEAEVQLSQQYALQTKKELDKLIYAQEHPAGAHSASGQMRYFQWKDNAGHKGNQLSMPLDFGYWSKDFSYSVSTQSVISRNDTANAGGQVNTVGDTSLSFSKRNAKQHFTVDYNMNMNLPTGKATLSGSERNAMMNEDLTDVSQFGKGWQFTPGVDVSWKIGKEDTWTIGSTYAFNGSYDPTGDIADDNVDPGNEWAKRIRWQHAGQKWQFVGEAIHTSTAATHIADGSSYTTGGQWEYRLTYNRKVSKNQNMMLYYWREDQLANDVVASDTSSSVGHYWGAMWSKQLDPKRVFRLSFDMMQSNGSRYDRIHNYDGSPQYDSVDVDGRRKYTLGIGYDVKVNSKSSFSIDLQRFRMHDGQSTLGEAPKTYKGLNVFLQYNRSL